MIWTVFQVLFMWKPYLLPFVSFMLVTPNIFLSNFKFYTDGHFIFISFQYNHIVHLESDFCRFSNVALQFSCLGHFAYCAIPLFFLEGEPPPPRSSPWRAYRPAISYEAIHLYHLALHCSIHSHTHSWQIEVWWLGMFQGTTCVLLCAPVT